MDANREKLIRVMTELSDIYPEMRFGQLISSVAHWAKGPSINAVYEVTDEEMILAGQKNISRHKGQTEN